MPVRLARRRFNRAGRRTRARIVRPGRIPPRRMRLPSRNLSAYPGRPFPGLPKEKRIVMRYVEVIQIDPSAGSTAKHAFRANSIFDPNQTGSGHQPLGHDQWEIFYNHYIVDKSTITVQFTPTSANQDGSLFGIYLSDDLTTPTSGLDIIEQGLATYKSGALGTNSAPSQMTVRNSFNAKSMYNIKDIKDNFDRFGAAFGADPTEVSFYTLFAQSLNSLAEPQPLFALVTIEYSVLLSEPKSLSQS